VSSTTVEEMMTISIKSRYLWKKEDFINKSVLERGARR